jgi:hypothetical protein
MIRYFTAHKVLSTVLTLILCATTTNFACHTQDWLNTIGQYLPLAIQIAQAIVQLVPIFASNAGSDDQALVKQISDEATKDFQLLQSLYQQYQSKPSPDTKAAIENALAVIVTNLPQMLATSHIKDQILLDKVTASVNVLVTVADIIISAIPVTNPQLVARKAQAKMKAVKQTPQTIKIQWNTQVCGLDPKCMALVH